MFGSSSSWWTCPDRPRTPSETIFPCTIAHAWNVLDGRIVGIFSGTMKAVPLGE